MGTNDFHKRISSDMKPVVNRPLDTQESSKEIRKKTENKTDITVYSNNKKEKRGMVLRTEKPQALYVALEKQKQSFLQTNKQEKGGGNDTKQNKHQKLQNAASAQSIRAENKTILWDGETKVKKRKKERKKERRRRDPVPSQQRQQQH